VDHASQGYEGLSDHEVILKLETQVQGLMVNLDRTEKENEKLAKTQGQISVVRLVFLGVLILVGWHGGHERGFLVEPKRDRRYREGTGIF